MTTTPKQRFLFFDLLRGWSLIIMIEAHVFNAFMKTELRAGEWFIVLNYINGLIAPAFLFVSGAVFYLSTFYKTDELRSFGPSFRKKLYRILLIFLAGYSLHLPFLSLQRMIHDTNYEMLRNLFAVDILQSIAAGLLLILVLKLIIKNERLFIVITGIIMLAVIFLSPPVSKLELTNFFPLYIADYFTGAYGSLFPLFPWLTYLLAGVLFAYLFLLLKENQALFFKYVFYSGTAVVIAGFILLADWFVPAEIRFIRPNPIFVIQRVGFVLIFISTCWYYYYKESEKKSFITEVGKESLIVYWLHLQIIYRQITNGQSFASAINNSFTAFESAAAWLILTLLMIAVAVYWSKIKQRYPRFPVLFVRIIVWGCIIIFFLN
jgi:uncharacterized membrane protein